MHICAFCYILNIFGVVVLHRSMADERRGGVRLQWVHMHSAIYENYLVLWLSRDLFLIGGGGGVSLPWHSTICETA